MKFTLVYEGELPPTGNKPNPKSVWEIRNEIAPQLDELWKTHSILKRLAVEGVHPETPGVYPWVDFVPGKDGTEYSHDGRAPHTAPPGWFNVVAPMDYSWGSYLPLVRSSLHATCYLRILFLRRDEPGSLFSQEGDLDNRLKALFDALRMPSGEEEAQKGSPCMSPLPCLLECDKLITGYDIRTDRYLRATSNRKSLARLTIEVDMRVTKVNAAN